MQRDEQGNKYIPMTPSFLVSLVLLLLGGGTAVGVKYNPASSDQPHLIVTSQQDHDAIIQLGSQVTSLKEDMSRLRSDVQENNQLMRRVVYGRGDAR